MSTLQNNHLKDHLLHFVTPQILELLREPSARLEKTEKEVAVLFLDIAGCSKLCENLPPSEMNRLVEVYFTRYFDIIQKLDGVVNEIAGDGFMALFEGNGYAEKIYAATCAAVEIGRATQELKREPANERYDTQVRMGIHAGQAFVGFTKFHAKRWERWTYTASGPVTNVAARLCQLASGGSILVSSSVARLVGDRYPLESLGPQNLKNVSSPIEVFRLIL